MQKINSIWKHWKHLKDKGQISILMALIFPILFIFFAMTINIGLLVHDKINLQNSVDLAAYYGATKQAEILNAIAHINYQMRQNWKLLSFRLRGFGDFGFNEHPWNQPLRTYSETPWKPPDPSTSEEIPASVCTQTADIWKAYIGSTKNQTGSSCKEPRTTLPGIPSVVPIAGFYSDYNAEVERITERLREHYANNCQIHGTTNWFTAAFWVYAYKQSLIIRKIAIQKLAQLLIEGKDLQGVDIKDGVQKTFINNLTRSNREAILPNKLVYHNSMSSDPWSAWLVERALLPSIYYTDSEATGGCEYSNKLLNDPPRHYSDTYLSNPDLKAFKDSNLDPFISEPTDPRTDTMSVNGMNISTASMVSYEKNPWYMVYYGFKAEVAPNEPFSPFGNSGPTMKAKAFAKPFGGRIGPWMFKSWPNGNPSSLYDNDPIDKMLQPIIRDDSGVASHAPPLDPNRVPNYSRYPGDALGLNSEKALGIYRYLLERRGFELEYLHFLDEKLNTGVGLLDSLEDPSYQYDPFAWDNSDPDPSAVTASPPRVFEVLAVAPDLFDITYYSIDPQFLKNHAHLMNVDNEDIKFISRVIDLGSRSNSTYDRFTVFDQWAWMKDSGHRDLLILPPFQTEIGEHGEWLVQDWKHLLTGWLPEKNLNESSFGNCHPNGDLTKAGREAEGIPGSCGIGGRTGYSVKLVSKEYLERDNLDLGGSGGSGSIENQPPDW